MNETTSIPENRANLNISDEAILLELQEAYKSIKQSKETPEYKKAKHTIEQNILLKKKREE